MIHRNLVEKEDLWKCAKEAKVISYVFVKTVIFIMWWKVKYALPLYYRKASFFDIRKKQQHTEQVKKQAYILRLQSFNKGTNNLWLYLLTTSTCKFQPTTAKKEMPQTLKKKKSCWSLSCIIIILWKYQRFQ